MEVEFIKKEEMTKEEREVMIDKVAELLRKLNNREGPFKPKKISKEEALEIIKREGLYDYGWKIEIITPKNGRRGAMENRILINKMDDDSYWVVVAGERARVRSEEFFEDIEDAYAYVIRELRLQKQVRDTRIK